MGEIIISSSDTPEEGQVSEKHETESGEIVYVIYTPDPNEEKQSDGDSQSVELPPAQGYE